MKFLVGFVTGALVVTSVLVSVTPHPRCSFATYGSTFALVCK